MTIKPISLLRMPFAQKEIFILHRSFNQGLLWHLPQKKGKILSQVR